MVRRLKTIVSSTMDTLRFQRCAPTQCNFPLEGSLQSTRNMSNQSVLIIPPDTTRLYPHRLSRGHYSRPPVVSATAPPLSPFPPNVTRFTPGAIKPTPLPVHMAQHTTARFPTRFSSPPQDSVAPDEPSNSPFNQLHLWRQIDGSNFASNANQHGSIQRCEQSSP
jgi:hypothetical protein